MECCGYAVYKVVVLVLQFGGLELQGWVDATDALRASAFLRCKRRILQPKHLIGHNQPVYYDLALIAAFRLAHVRVSLEREVTFNKHE